MHRRIREPATRYAPPRRDPRTQRLWDLAGWVLFIAVVAGIILLVCAAAWVVAP